MGDSWGQQAAVHVHHLAAFKEARENDHFWKIAMVSYVKRKLNVQYGCGLCAPGDWLNFDVSPTLRLQKIPVVGSIITANSPIFPPAVRYGDIVRGLPLEDSSCSAIYCSHVLEHLSLLDLRRALFNTHRYLQPGATFRFVVPDLEFLAREYIESPAADAAIRFMQQSFLGTPQRPRGIGGLLRMWLGNSKHLWMWDFKSLARELENVGFTSVRRAHIGDSGNCAFESVEELGRWQNCLGVECIR